MTWDLAFLLMGFNLPQLIYHHEPLAYIDFCYFSLY